MRAKRVHDAWMAAYSRIAVAYGSDGPTISQIRDYSPVMASEIETAEREAEEVSVKWRDHNGPGGVQAKIDAWVTAWLTGMEATRAAA